MSSRASGARARLHAVSPAGAAAEPVPRRADEQLERILRSETFQRCDRLKRLLAFIVRETTAGRGAELKEYVIGVQVFRKEESFDPRTDPIVRVQARRLRAKLTRYYRDEGRGDPTVIDLPKGGYAALIKARDQAAPPKRSIGAALVSRNTIGILPFADHSDDGSLGGLCIGLREELVHRLTRLRGLRILAAPGSPAAPDPSPGNDGADPGAGLVIAGGVRRSGSRIRADVHLIDAASGSYLWSAPVDGTVARAFAWQELVARTVADALEPHQTQAAGRAGPTTRPAANLAAQSLTLQGRYHFNQRTDDGLRQALVFFERALTEDAQDALAHSGVADACGLLAHYGVRRPADVWAKAAASASLAVALDDGSAEAHTSLALVAATQDWNWTEAEREFQRAISLNPNYATAHHWYAAACLVPLGRLQDALDEATLAQSLDPVSAIVARDVAMIHYYRRDFEAALEQCDHTIELNPHFAPAYWLLGLIQAQRRDFDESLAALQLAVRLSPQTPRMHGALGRTFALAGRRQAALQVLRKLESYATERYVSPLEFAWIQFGLGDVDKGFRWLADACRDRTFDLIALRVDPRFDAIRGDARLEAIADALGPHPPRGEGIAIQRQHQDAGQDE